jgi:2,5-dihydroxypyridine 5,6-dioxygenase
MNELLRLAAGAANCIRFGNVHSGETVLLLVEPGMDDHVIEAISFAAKSVGAEVCVLVKEPTKLGQPLNPVVAAAIKATDMLYDFGGPTSHSEAGFLASFDYGTRYLLVRPEPEALIAESALVPNELIYLFGTRTQKIVRENPALHITDDKGSDFRVEPIPGTIGAYIGPRPCESGPAVPGYIGTFPGATTVFGDINYTGNGRLVLDAALTFDIPSEPIVFTIKDGWVTGISGGPEADFMWETAQSARNATRLAECGFGLNPKVPLLPAVSRSDAARAVNIMSWSRRAGTFFIAMGGNQLLGGTDPSSATPMFGVVKQPTITAGDVIVVKDGRLVMADQPDTEIVELCQRFGGTAWLTPA